MALATTTGVNIAVEHRPIWPRPLVAFMHQLRKELFGGYRPELHYMRGPGPAWHAKHGYAKVGFAKPE